MKFQVITGKEFEIGQDFDFRECSEEVVSQGVEILAQTTRSALAGHTRTSALVGSVKPGDPEYKDRYGGYHAAINFVGKDKNGIRNGLKAAELEYGNTYQPATPFADRAIHAAEPRVKEIAENILKERWGND